MGNISFMRLVHIKWRYKVNSKICEYRMEGWGLDSNVHLGITGTQMLFKTMRLDEITKKASKNREVHEVLPYLELGKV